MPSPPESGFLETLRAALHDDVDLVVGDEAPRDAHVLVSGVPTAAQLAALPSLQTLVVPYAGLPARTRALLLEQGDDIRVHNLHHNASATAELALALLLAAAKRIVPMDQQLRTDDWTPRYDPSQVRLLAGKTAVVLGVGAVGRRVVRALKALGMDVIGVRRDDAQEIDALLPRADVVMCCLPGTPRTDGLIDERALARFPAGALLVNVGRAAAIDEDALFAALQSGRLGAAGLDVWYAYPQSEDERAQTPPSAHRFGDLDNVVLSPHRGGQTEETERLRAEGLAKLLNQAAAGEPIDNAVDVERGY